MAYLQYFIYIRAAIVWTRRNLPSVGVYVYLSPAAAYALFSTLVQLQHR